MAYTNPTRFSFQMPTTRVDETTITGQMSANVYMDGTQIVAYPTALNPGDRGEMLFADLGWQPEPGKVHSLSLTAQEGEQESAHSAPVEIQFVGKPNAPTGLSVS